MTMVPRQRIGPKIRMKTCSYCGERCYRDQNLKCAQCKKSICRYCAIYENGVYYCSRCKVDPNEELII